MRTFRLGAFAFACAAVWATGADAEVMTLNEALSTAYDSNPQLGAARANLRATDEGVAQANAGWRPTINAQGQYGVEHEQFGSVSVPGQGIVEQGGDINERPLQGQLTVTEPLFRGGKTYAEIGRAKALVREGRAELLDTEQQVMLASVTAYMNVARDEATVNLEQNNVSVLQKQLDATQEQFKVGELTKTDVAQSQARLAGAQAQVTIARGQLAASRANFEQVIGRPAETLDDQPPFPKMPKSEDAATDIATKSSPIVLSANEAERAADYAVDDAVGSLAPQVSVQGQYQYQQLGAGAAAFGEPGTAHVASVFGMVTVPIYQGGAEEASVRQAKELHGQTQLLVLNADRQARANVQAAWETYESAQASIASDKVQVTADTTALEGVRKEQEVGARTILDVLNAQQELLNAQVTVISAERDAYVAAYELLQATGELTARYLALNVKFYDETEHYDDDANKWIGFGN